MIRLEKSEGVYGPTIQGEGINIGINVAFVRLYGCDFRCKWCDTPFSLGKDMGGEYEEVDAYEILNRLENLLCTNVVISGGNPLSQGKLIDPLLSLLSLNKYFIQVETQGSINPTDIAFSTVDFWSLSPKLRSAGIMESENWKAVPYIMDKVGNIDKGDDEPHPDMQLKFVVADRDDYDFLKDRITELGKLTNIWMPIVLQPEGQQNNQGAFDYLQYAEAFKQIFQWTVEDYNFWDLYDIRVLPQLHKLIYQKERKR